LNNRTKKNDKGKSLHPTSKEKKTTTTPSNMRIQYVRTNEKEETNNVLHIQNSLMFFVFRKVDKFKVYVYTCFLLVFSFNVF